MVQGFTLIEMMIVVAITGMIAAGGIASYSKFRERIQIQTEANMVVARLRKIQSIAGAVEAPTSGCTQSVSGFTVTMLGTNMTVVINCGNSVSRNDLGLTLGSSKFRSNYAVTFTSPQIGASPVTIDVCSKNNDYQFTINSLGGISTPVQATPPGGPCP